jgi:hypothetical protein
MWMRFCWLVLLCFVGMGDMEALAQTSPNPWMLLHEPDSVLRGDVVSTERVIDLVDAWVADSVVWAEKQRLNGFGGWFIQKTWARYWVYFTDHKQKYVGSMSREYHVFDGPSDELDINIFVMPHLEPYVGMVRSGFDKANARPRPDKGFRIDSPENYPLPEELYFEKVKQEEKGYLTIECEVTPPQALADDLAKSFFPVEEGEYDLDTVPNFGTRYPSVGMTGVWCMDCNHNCRPEIHPIEWLWWLDLSAERPGSPMAKSWMVSLMVDGSRRFHDWTKSPITGGIAIPVTAPFGSMMVVTLQKIVADGLQSELGTQLADQAYQSGDTSFTLPYFPERDIYPALDLRVRTVDGWPRTGVSYWFTGIHPTEQGWAGYLHIAATMQSMLAIRVTVDSVVPH